VKRRKGRGGRVENDGRAWGLEISREGIRRMQCETGAHPGAHPLKARPVGVDWQTIIEA